MSNSQNTDRTEGTVSGSPTDALTHLNCDNGAVANTRTLAYYQEKEGCPERKIESGEDVSAGDREEHREDHHARGDDKAVQYPFLKEVLPAVPDEVRQGREAAERVQVAIQVRM